MRKIWLIAICGMMFISSIGYAENCGQGNALVEDAVRLYRQGTPDYPKIVELLKQAKEQCPKWSAPSRYLGDVFAKQKKYDEAIGYYHEAVKIDKDDFEAYLYLGDAYYDSGKAIHALRFYSKGIDFLESDIRLKGENLDLLQKYQKKRTILSKDHLYQDEKKLSNALDKKKATKLGVRPKIDTYIEFETGAAKIDEDWQAQADTIAEVLKNNVMKNYRVIIQGHTDTRGSAESNYRLSLQRAVAVKNYLLESGVSPASVFDAEGKGEDYPLSQNDGETDEEWHRRNRRVVFVSCGKEEEKEECMKKAGAE